MDSTYDEVTGGESRVEQQPAEYQKKYYTVEERDAFDEGFRTELHDGLLIVMESPVVKHQRIHRELFGQFWTFLKGKTCEVFSAPFDVRLNMNEHTIFQPDILVICDKSIIENGKNCLGAPDLIIEILSPTTSRADKVYKFNKYQKAQVREYWIVDPDAEFVQVNVYSNGSYITSVYDKDASVPVSVLPGCVIDLNEVFGE